MFLIIKMKKILKKNKNHNSSPY